MRKVVKNAKIGNEEWFRSRTTQRRTNETEQCFTSYFDEIYNTRIFIGSRRSGRPPECWNYFDAIVNVTMMEYDEFLSNNILPEGKFYLQLPVQEGKRDRTELEKWIPLALLFIGINLNQRNRILIHCAQGMDRSVAIAMAAVCIYFPNLLHGVPMHANQVGNGFYLEWISTLSYSSARNYLLTHHQGINIDLKDDSVYRLSGFPQILVEPFMGKNGRNLFLSFLQRIKEEVAADKFSLSENEIFTNKKSVGSPSGNEVFANKESLRIALLFIQQYRPKACPTRKTMQKLNRFFMSGIFEPPSY